MYNPNANWTARKGARDQSPVWYIAIDGLTTKHFSTAPVRNAAVTKKVLLKVPDEIGQKIDPMVGRVSVRLSRLDLVDAADEITDLIATEKTSPTLPTLLNRTLTLYEGDATLDESDYAPIAVGQITDVELLEGGTTYRLTIADAKRAQNEDLFTNADASGLQPYSDVLGAGASVGAKSFAALNVPSLQEGDNVILGPSSHGSYTGGEEKAVVAAVLGATVYVVAALTKSYLTGDSVRWATTVVQGNAINLWYALHTGDFASGTFPLDIAVGLPTGLGIPAALIDTASLIKERDRIASARTMRFEIRQATAGFRFIEHRFNHLGYPYYRGDGKLSFRLYRPAWPDDAAAGLTTLTEADINSWAWKRRYDWHVNKVALGLDFDIETSKAAETWPVEDTADQTSTKETAAIELADSGLRTALAGRRSADAAGAALLRRYLKPPPILTVRCGSHKKAIEIGDVVVLTHARIPNHKTGARGYAAVRMEIVEKTEKLGGGGVEFGVLDAGFVRPAFWGPSGTITGYDAASAAEREYAYWANTGTPPGNFPDGTPPYEVI